MPPSIPRTLTPTIPIEPIMKPRDAFRLKVTVADADAAEGIARLFDLMAKRLRETGELDVILP